MSSSSLNDHRDHDNHDRYRSRLEEMLESLKQREESEKGKDKPPALPSRPTSRARPPTRPPPSNKFDISDSTNFTTTTATNTTSSSVERKADVKKRSRDVSFGVKKPKEAGPDESPYASLSVDFQQSVQDKDSNNHQPKAASPARSKPLPRFRESDLNDNLGYFIKKVYFLYSLFYYSCY